MQSVLEKPTRGAGSGGWMAEHGQSGLASIIIPTFNRAKLLDETLASAVEQTYRPIEIIVVDDGSTDDTTSVVESWQHHIARDPDVEIRYLPQENAGVGAARNHGLIESHGEFIQFLDSDDILHPRKLEIQIGLLERYPESGYAFSHMARLEDMGEWPKIALQNAKLTDAADFYCNPLVLTMVGVYRRTTCHAAGPWLEDIHLGEDEEYGFRALLSIDKVVYLPQNLCAFRDHAGARLTDMKKVRNGLGSALDTYRRMAIAAQSAGRLNDPRLAGPLSQRMTGTIVRSMELGYPDLASEAIRACRKLPVSFGRRLRLAMYQFLNSLPAGTFQRIWPAWLKLRQSLMGRANPAA
jgi:hypothetical protein